MKENLICIGIAFGLAFIIACLWVPLLDKKVEEDESDIDL